MMTNANIAPQFAMLFALQIMACSPTQSDTNDTDDIPPDMYSSTGQIYYLEPSERDVVEARALKGDKKALVAIINHYELGGVEDNIDPLMYWLRIAYQGGDEKRLRDLVFYARDSDLDCVEIVSYYDALQKLDPKDVRELRTGKVAACLSGRS